MAITTTGSFIQAHGTTTVNFTVANVGDLLVVAVADTPDTVTVTGCSGNNSLGTMSSTASVSDSGLGASIRLFWAKAGATGTVTITPTFSGTETDIQYDGWMFTAGFGSGTVWGLDTSNTLVTVGGTGAGSLKFPSLTAAGSGELYVGCGVASGSGSAGSTSGFTYNADTGFTNVFCYNPSSSGTLAPTAADSSSGDKIAVAALITASSGAAAANPGQAIVMPSLAASMASIW